MSRKNYIIFNIATGLLKGAFVLLLILWIFPLVGVAIPIWVLSIIVVAFIVYEVVTFRLGMRALARKPSVLSGSIVGCCGIATTPLNPGGYVQVKGELWRAFSNGSNINKGDDIIVVESDRLTLRVAPFSETMRVSR